jgi:aspartyl-tRNA(Asn)/glutamyl-tRNA(Gln) amidotransferase subunit A
MDPLTLAAVDLAAAIRARKVSSREATAAALARAEKAHAKCNAVIALEREEAMEAADHADRLAARGGLALPLGGVPIANKDMFDRVGKIASWGARIRAKEPAARDATVIARLKAAGSHQIAATHLTEFAFGPTGHNYVIGHARNPWDASRITGGSSSGSAILVAAGAVPLALGSDTAGSLRLPAAACGVASLKGTWTRVSRAGAMPLSGFLDCVGPIARDVRDLALAFGVIAGADGRDGIASSRRVPDYLRQIDQPVTGLRIGVDDGLIAAADPLIQRRFETALKVLEAAGGQRVQVSVPEWRTIDHLTQLLQLPEVASAHGAFLRQRAADYGPQVRARIEYGHFIPSVDHQTAQRARGRMLERVLAEVYGKADVLALPTFADPLPTIEALDVAGGPKLMAAMARVIYFARPINYLGLPALTLPYPPDDLPNGFQLVGRPFAEATLLRLGRRYQRDVPPLTAPL